MVGICQVFLILIGMWGVCSEDLLLGFRIGRWISDLRKEKPFRGEELIY